MEIVGRRGQKKKYMGAQISENKLQEKKISFVWLKAQGVKGNLRETRSFEYHTLCPVLLIWY